MPATRLMPTEEGQDLIDLTREICDKELRPRVDEAERAAASEPRLPVEAFRTLGRAGLLSLPYPEEFGGGAQPYEVYLQVVEEIASAWMSVAVGVSVHGLTCYPVAQFGTDAQKEALLPAMLSGEQLGAYCLSERSAGSDVAAMTARATPDDAASPTAYVLKGTKAWISHAGHADFYTSFVRTSDEGSRGLSCFVVPGGRRGPGVRDPRAEDGAALRHRERGALRGRLGRRRPARGRARPGHGHRAVRPRLRPARDRRRRNRTCPGRAGCGGRLRQGAHAVRPADRAVPGPGLPPRGHGGGRHLAPAPPTCTRPGCGTPVGRSPRRLRWPSSSAPTRP